MFFLIAHCRGDTHKNDVLLFCQRKAKECIDDMDLDDRESAELIWRFLELLIKQNGVSIIKYLYSQIPRT